MPKTPTYEDAIEWFATANTYPTDWLDDDEPILPGEAAIVVDLFGVTEDQVVQDIKTALDDGA